MRYRRLACWALAFVLGVPAWAGAQGRLPDVVIENVQVGFPRSLVGDHREAFKAGAWAPVTVALTAGPKGIVKGDYALVVESADSDDAGNAYLVPLGSHAAHSLFRVQTLTKPGGWTKNIRVSVRRQVEGRNPADWPEVAVHNGNNLPSLPAELLCLTVGERPQGLRQALEPQAAKEPTAQPEFEHAALSSVDKVAELPTSWFAYDAVDLVVLTTRNDKFLGDLLEDPQHQERREALLEWVRRGGRLVVSVGQNQDVFAKLRQQPKHRDLEALLPAVVGDKVQRPRLDGLREWARAKQAFPGPDDPQVGVVVARLEPKPGSLVLARDKDLPLIVQGPYGLGRVVLAGFDLEQEALARWEGNADFWKNLVRLLKPKAADRSGARATFGRFGEDNEQSLALQLRRSLENFGEVPVISFGWVALFILLYILVVGPLDYFFLKNVVKRLELTWITFPTVVLAVSALAYFAAYHLKGDQLRINKVDVVDVDLRGRHVLGTTWFTLFSPRIQHYTIGLEPVSPAWGEAPGGDRSAGVVLTSLDCRDGGQGRQSLFHRTYDYEPEASGLRGVPIQVWSTKTFTASWRLPLAGPPLVSADLSHPPDSRHRIRGRITSHLAESLTEVVVFYRGQLFPIGALVPEVPQEVAGLASTGQDLSRWFAALPSAGAPAGGSPGVPRATFPPAQASVGIVKEALFHGANTNAGWDVHDPSLRRLDQSWRLRQENEDEVILVGRLATAQGKAEEVAQGPASPSRLWLDRLPGTGPRPPLAGALDQDTLVRVFLPVGAN